MKNILNKLWLEKLISEPSYDLLSSIAKRQVISVNFELRLILYLGIMMFTGSIGYLVYQNIGEVGHYLAMAGLFIAIGVGSFYIHSKSKPYSPLQITIDHIYYDYFLVLVGLLLIALFTYIQVYFELVDKLATSSSLATAIIFFYIAYRYDSKMLLSLAITALAASLGLKITSSSWVEGAELNSDKLSSVGVGFGIALLIVGHLLNFKKVKGHFTFTYLNFGYLLTFSSLFAFVFDEQTFFCWIILLIAILVSIYSWKEKQFLFFLYGIVSGYVAFTTVLLWGDLIPDFLFFYFPISLVGGIIALIKNKDHFSDDN